MKTRASADSTSSGGNEGWAVMTTLIGGFVVWGGIGWLLDRWLETRFLTPVGLIVGMSLGIYAVVAKFGRDPQTASTTRSTAPSAPAGSAPTPRVPTQGTPPASTRRETECP